MSMFINFPASCYMTEFEIVELQNDMIRTRRLEEIELAEQTRRLEQDDIEIEDINIIARGTSGLVQNIDRFPLISPIHSTPTPTRISPINQNNQDREFKELPGTVNTNCTDEEDIHEESEESSEEEEDIFEESEEPEGNSKDTDTKDDQQDDYNKDKGEEKEKNTTDPNSRLKTNDDTSNSGDSFHSPLSTISPKSSNNDKEQTIEEEGEATPKQNPKIYDNNYNNDIGFVNTLNDSNITWGVPKTVLSAIRPSFHCPVQNDFFICHICLENPKEYSEIRIAGTNKIITLKEKRSFTPRGTVTPKCIGGILEHLSSHHSILRDKRISLKAAREIAVMNDAFTSSSPPFGINRISKYPSDSCMNSAWKSNQTDLTKRMTNRYVFHENYCRGHTKQFFTEGIIYEMDLANSVYCTCRASTINRKESKKDCYSDFISKDKIAKLLARKGPTIIDQEIISRGHYTSFFYQNKRSIKHAHKTLQCPYKVVFDISDLKEIQDHTAPPERANTRSMAKQEKEEIKKRREIEMAINEDIKQSSENVLPSKRQEPEGASPKTPRKKNSSTINKTKASSKSPWQQIAHSAVDLLQVTPKKKAKKPSKN
jgi:hypothetical protein